MSFYLLAWLAAISYGLETITGKLISKYKVKNPWQFAFTRALFGYSFILPFALYNNGNILPSAWENLILAGIFSALSGTFIILAISKLDVSILSPLFNFRTAFSVFLSFLILGELLTANQYFLIFILFIAGIFVSMDEKFSARSFFTPNVGIALLMCFFLALFSIFSSKSISQNGYWTHVFWLGIIFLSFYSLLIPFFYKEVTKTQLKSYVGIYLMAVLNSTGTMLSLKAFETNVSITTAIISLPISMFLAYIFSVVKPTLLEKHSTKVYLVRFTAAAVMFYAVLSLR